MYMPFGEMLAVWDGFILAGDDVIVCGWGQTDGVHSIGLFTIGANWLCDKMVTR